MNEGVHIVIDAMVATHSPSAQDTPPPEEPRYPEPRQVGRIVGGRYVLQSQIGIGGMGVVWEAFDRLLQRRIAVKEVLIQDGLPERERDLLCERTLREARAAARLDHPSVIRVYDVVQEDGRPWIIMELLEARSLAEIIGADGPLTPLRCAEVTLAVLSALQSAHRLGILHRDVKPGNVLLCPNGRVVLTDFGVARSPEDSRLTSTGLLLGSPQYIAPERARGCPFGPASDLFSLGATAFASIEGNPPFDRGEAIRTMTAVVCEPPAPMPHAGPMEEIVLGLLEKEPHGRWDAERTRLALRAVIAAERRRTAEDDKPTETPQVERTSKKEALKPTEPADRHPSHSLNFPHSRTRGRHRRGGPHVLLGALTRPLMTAAEATAAIVLSRRRTDTGRHSIPTPSDYHAIGTPSVPPYPRRSDAWTQGNFRWSWVLIGLGGLALGLGLCLAILALV